MGWESCGHHLREGDTLKFDDDHRNIDRWAVQEMWHFGLAHSCQLPARVYHVLGLCAVGLCPAIFPTLPLPAQTGASFEYVLHLSREFRDTPTAKLITSSTMSANNEQFYLRY